ncbi:HDOD domain-containing protein [bacterium]|nr:HDOD domain-containing protein [bacterium]
MAKHRILFVDDQPKVLDAIRRVLKPLQSEWETVYVADAQDALDTLEQKPFDVAVCDTRMPSMSGTELFKKLKQRYPTVVRVALSGHSERETVLSQARTAHQFLIKPCDPADLVAIVARACRMGRLLSSPRLRKMITEVDTIPSLPSLYIELIREIDSLNSTVASIGGIVSRDPGMTAKILQLVNSAFFSRGRKILNPGHAVSLLGLDTVKALAISIHAFAQFDVSKVREMTLEDIWSHSLAVAVFAKWIGVSEGLDKEALDHAFVSGLLHDVGMLVLADKMPLEFEEAIRIAAQGEVDMSEAERQTVGASHAELGAYLLGLWGLPDSVIEALAFHHSPADSRTSRLSPLTLVHVANVLAQEFYTWQTEQKPAEIDETYLASLNLLHRLDPWRDACRAAMREQWGYAC